MLLVLYGLSCTGKSAIMKKLVEDHSYVYINCYTTRPPRPNDKARIPVTEEEYQRMRDAGEFIFSNEHYRGSYGTPKKEIENAIDDPNNKYVIDYMIQNKGHFEGIRHHKILVVPDSIQSLNKWIIGSGRIERLQTIQKEYETFYTPAMIEKYKAGGFHCLINPFDLLDNIVNEIVEIVNNDNQ